MNMSSATNSIKKQPGEVAVDEPNSKRAKIAEKDTTASDVKNGTTKHEKVAIGDNNSGASKGNSSRTPKKVVNGVDKESKSELLDEYNEKDDDGDGANLDGVFDPKIAKSLEEVENIQLEICNLNEKASEEILTVEQKFNKLRRPHFEKRNELLKEIPNFWLTSLANHPIIAPMIESAEDEDCLHYMVNLDVEEFEDIKSGYRLKLHFVENPYIANKVIVKEFQIVSSEEVLSSSTPIEYKDTTEGNNLKQIVDSSIARYNRRSARPGQTQQSFFAWLVEPSESGTDEVAEILKDQIWPNPLEFFFATPDDYGTGTDDESDDEDEEIDDEEIDDEEIIAEGGVDFSEEELDGEEEDEEDEDE